MAQSQSGSTIRASLGMSQSERNVLIAMSMAIRKNVDLEYDEQCILMFLKSKFIITEDMFGRILFEDNGRKKPKKSQVDALMDILTSGGSDAFQSFIAALRASERPGHADLATALQEKLTEVQEKEGDFN